MFAQINARAVIARNEAIYFLDCFVPRNDALLKTCIKQKMYHLMCGFIQYFSI